MRVPFPVIAPALSLAVLIGADAAGAETVAQSFKDVCMLNGPGPAAVTTAAASHGWKNGDASGSPIAGFTVDTKVSRTTHIGGANVTLFAWHGAKGAIQADECQVEASKASFEEVRDAVASDLSMQPQQVLADKAVFQHSVKDGAFQGIADKSGFDAAAGAGGLHLLTVKKNGAGVFVSLLKIHS